MVARMGVMRGEDNDDDNGDYDDGDGDDKHI